MLSSEYLYGGLDIETAKLQKALFEQKLKKAQNLINILKPDFDTLDFTQKQKDLEWRIGKIKKAMQFSHEQIDEANQILSEPEV